MRTFAQADVDELAAHASIPVINGLTDAAHPCQALADVMTIRERFGRLEGVRVVYLGDGNNVCASLMVACAKLGMQFVAATPAGYGIDEELVRLAGEDAVVLHCLPAHYGEEITEDVLYGAQSAVWDQAENRLHAQKALMALVIR